MVTKSIIIKIITIDKIIIIIIIETMIIMIIIDNNTTINIKIRTKINIITKIISWISVNMNKIIIMINSYIMNKEL